MSASLPLRSLRPAALRRWRVSSPRCVSTSVADAARQMLDTFEGKGVTRTQVLDGPQLQKLSLTLNRPRLHAGLDVSAQAPPAGTPLPPGYHLVYFSPAAVESELGADGTDRTFNAPAPFSRRMWAGGRMYWPEPRRCRLKVGDEVEERTRLVGATAKKARDGTEMVLVDVEKEFWVENGLALVDQRSWIFRPPPVVGKNQAAKRAPLQPPFAPSTVSDVLHKDQEHPERRLSWSPVALFRFSALTFNAHVIHYNETATRETEGHPNVVVHGPLNLINMLDYWRDMYSGDKHMTEISYRAMSPLYAGDEYVIRTDYSRDFEDEQTWDIVVEKDGGVCMKAEIVAA